MGKKSKKNRNSTKKSVPSEYRLNHSEIAERDYIVGEI